VHVIDPEPGLPDMVFAANGATVIGERYSAPGFTELIEAKDEDAEVLGLNAVSDGRHVVLRGQAAGLAAQMKAAGFEPVPVDLSELLKAGGGPKCCTLELR